jgi:toxin ParE1/3/4
MISRVEWSREARRDLLDIYEFIAVQRREAEAARRLIRSIRRKAEAYGRQPGMGTLHEEIDLPGEAGPARSFRVKSHIAIYRETPTGIIVLRVVHGRRDLPSLFEA